MKTPHLDNEIQKLKTYRRHDMLSEHGIEHLKEFEAIKHALIDRESELCQCKMPSPSMGDKCSKCDKVVSNAIEQSGQLKALEDLKDFAYDNCQPHNSDRLAEIMERL